MDKLPGNGILLSNEKGLVVHSVRTQLHLTSKCCMKKADMRESTGLDSLLLHSERKTMLALAKSSSWEEELIIDRKVHDGTYWRDKNILYLHYGGSSVIINICQNPSKYMSGSLLYAHCISIKLFFF